MEPSYPLRALPAVHPALGQLHLRTLGAAIAPHLRCDQAVTTLRHAPSHHDALQMHHQHCCLRKDYWPLQNHQPQQKPSLCDMSQSQTSLAVPQQHQILQRQQLLCLVPIWPTQIPTCRPTAQFRHCRLRAQSHHQSPCSSPNQRSKPCLQFGYAIPVVRLPLRLEPLFEFHPAPKATKRHPPSALDWCGRAQAL